jgi:membrane associated rhomboid family serine protease
MTELRPRSFEILPIVIKNLLIINVLFFFAQKTLGAGSIINMEDLLGLHHVKSPLFQPWQLVTHLFLHGNFMHLFSNMFALWMFGTHLETLWGPKRFLTFYFLCGIGAGLIQLAFLWFDYQPLLNQVLLLKEHITPDGVMNFFSKYGVNSNNHNNALSIKNYLAEPDNSSNMAGVFQAISDTTYALINNATIGASGAVFGILAAFVYLFPNTNLYFYFLFPVKAKWVGLAYFGYEIYSGILNSTNDNIAHWAHIGGGLVGFLLVLMWNKKNRRTFY